MFPESEIARVEQPGAHFNTRAVSDAQEKYNARLIAGQRVVASGALSHDKSDVKAADVRMECKSTGARQYTLRRADLEKNEAHAKGNEMPVFAVEFRESDGDPRRQFMVVSEPFFMQMLEAWRARDQDHR